MARIILKVFLAIIILIYFHRLGLMQICNPLKTGSHVVSNPESCATVFGNSRATFGYVVLRKSLIEEFSDNYAL